MVALETNEAHFFIFIPGPLIKNEPINVDIEHV